MKTPQEWVNSAMGPFEYGELRWALTLKDIEAIQDDAFESGREAGLEEARKPQLIACTKCGKSMRKHEGFVDGLRQHHICFDCMTKVLSTQPKDTTCSKKGESV